MIAGSIAAALVSPASCGLRLDDPGHPAVRDGRDPNAVAVGSGRFLDHHGLAGSDASRMDRG